MKRLALVVALLLVPAIASARRAPIRPPPPVGDSAASASGAVGAGARAHIAMEPDLTTTTFRQALQRTSGQLEQCMVTSGTSGSLRVTARVALSHALDFDIVAPHHDAQTTQCAELVLRRALTGIAASPITTPLRATLTVRHRATRPPRVVPPAPPPATGDLSAFEGPVHAAIERDRSAMISCLSAASPGTTGEATLRMTLAPDGTLSLASASLPTGVSAAPALPCLSSRIAQLRFSPAPPSAVTITHTLPLGL